MGTKAQVSNRKNLFTNRTAQPALPTSSSSGAEVPADIRNAVDLVAEIQFTANGGDCTLTGPVALYGYRQDRWNYLGDLNRGGDIVLINGGVGYLEALQYIATFQRLEVRSAAISANGYDVDLTTISVMGAG